MTATEVLLRPADSSDADAVADIHLASRAEAAMPPGVHTDEEVRGWLTGRLAHDDVWLAELDGAPVGYARMTPTWLDDLYVVPSAAGRGVGSALLDVVKSRRPGGFCLWVFETNAPARAFYARHGLVELEHTDGSANEEQAPDVRMAWPGEDPLTFYRTLIDEVDDELAALLERRAALTRAVQEVKGGGPRDEDREREIASRMARQAPSLGPDRLSRIVHTVISESLDAAGS